MPDASRPFTRLLVTSPASIEAVLKEASAQADWREGLSPLLYSPMLREGDKLDTFTVEISIGDHVRDRWVTMDALVAPEPSITSIPASVLRELGVEPDEAPERFRPVRGDARPMRAGCTWLRVAGREVLTHVLFDEEDTSALLGALTLDTACLGVDPVEQKLVSVGEWPDDWLACIGRACS